MDKHSSPKLNIDQLISVDFSKNEQLQNSLFLRFRKERLPLRLAATMLATIKATPEKLDVVLGLQQVLIYKIGECDLRIARLNKAQKRIPRILARPEFRVGGAAIKARSTNLKRLREGIMDRIKEVRHLAYLWRCFTPARQQRLNFITVYKTRRVSLQKRASVFFRVHILGLAPPECADYSLP